MGKNPAQLNQKQVDVLRWIDDGCPDGVYVDGYEHRIVARALQNRGLVTISGRGPTWSARVTKAGRQWQAAPPAVVLPDESEADRLIGRVLDAGGRLTLPEDREVESAHERLVRMSLKSPARPRGKRLEMVSTGHWGQGPKTIEFVEHFDDLVEPRPVPIPEGIGKYHPAVRAYVSNKEWQYVTTEYIGRAARILQALANEASKRGLVATDPGSAAKGLPDHQAREARAGHLALRTPAGVYSIQVKEIAGKGGQKTARRGWNERKVDPAWIENRGWEFISTGKLELIVRGPGSAYGGDHYRDAKTITVEDRLPELLRSFEVHKLRADWQEQERNREKADRRQRWERAMALAKEEYFAHARWEHFKERSREWQAINQHRGFLKSARAGLGQYEGEDRDLIEQQLDEAEQTIDTLDSIRHPARIVPNVPEPKAEDLKPFLHGWSVHGPDGSPWG
ncbi:hypothetical protein [Promicromonospora sukumoe]|uniref:hypothetical protein n=1 Tax=Promicromonospora sukumoe TaxID=88382 RepID=UPI000366FBBA|nr:hypothetical protein [Promicromonospora sukumoe]